MDGNPPNYPCPLSESHCDQLDQLLYGESIQMDWLKKCQSAGLNVDKLIADCQRRHQLATGLKQQFFPHRQ